MEKSMFITSNRGKLKLSVPFIKIFAFLAITCILNNMSFAQKPVYRHGPTMLKPSLNAYSFNRMLLSKDDNGEVKFTLFDLLDWCAEQNIPAIDVTGYYFPGYPEVPSDEYINKFKRRAFQLSIDISGTGVRNNFASPDPKVRAESVELAKAWIAVASKLGAPVIRLFAGKIPEGYEDNWEEVAGWMIDCFKECVEFGENHGVLIGIQNHGDMLQTADQCIYVLKKLDSPWAGVIVDTGKFLVQDPYEDIDTITPYAVNWQVKESAFDKNRDIRIDMVRLVKILNKHSYRGYLPVETLEVKGQPYDPFVLVPQLIDELQSAISSEGKTK